MEELEWYTCLEQRGIYSYHGVRIYNENGTSSQQKAILLSLPLVGGHYDTARVQCFTCCDDEIL